MKNTFVKYGLYYGIVSIILFLLIWLFAQHLFGSMTLSFMIIFLTPIPFFVLACKEARIANDGYLDFGKAFLICMGVSIIGILITSLFNIVLYNFIDPGLETVIKEQMIENFAHYESAMGEEQFDKMIEGVENQSLAGPAAILQGFFTMFFCQLFVALIIAGIMKKSKPVIFD